MEANFIRMIDVFLEGATKPLLVIVGQTVSGKTSLSIEMAKHVDGPARPNGCSGGEIVNCDSRQLYKYLNIGTAKITEEDMQGIPHHLIDVLDPKEELTVGRYQEQAQKIINNIHERGKIPLLVGGSMLYISSIIDGLTLAPAVELSLHKKLEDEYDRDGGVALYKKLQSIDPEAAASIHPNNKPYVVRAMEIYEATKMPKSATAKKVKSPYDLLMFGVERSDVKKRIEERFDIMLEQGWIEEVQELMRRGYSPDDPGMKSCGYKEIMRYLHELESGDADPEDMKEELKKKILSKTRQYAKRQMTWWRGDERIRWINEYNS